jgi:hypothetical protein
LEKIIIKRSFLLLELLIALFLVVTCALPLARIPIRALQKEFQSASAMEMHRLADLAFAEIKEKVYRHEIPWEQIVKKTVVMNDSKELAQQPFYSKKITRVGTLTSVGKKRKDGQELRLVTFRLVLSHSSQTQRFVYQFLVTKDPG